MIICSVVKTLGGLNLKAHDRKMLYPFSSVTALLLGLVFLWKICKVTILVAYFWDHREERSKEVSINIRVFTNRAGRKEPMITSAFFRLERNIYLLRYLGY